MFNFGWIYDRAYQDADQKDKSNCDFWDCGGCWALGSIKKP